MTCSRRACWPQSKRQPCPKHCPSCPHQNYLLILFYFLNCICLCARMHAHKCPLPPAGVGPPLIPRGSWGSNSGGQAWWQMLQPTEPLTGPCFFKVEWGQGSNPGPHSTPQDQGFCGSYISIYPSFSPLLLARPWLPTLDKPSPS